MWWDKAHRYRELAAFNDSPRVRELLLAWAQEAEARAMASQNRLVLGAPEEE